MSVVFSLPKTEVGRHSPEFADTLGKPQGAHPVKTFKYGANFKVVGKCDPDKLSYPGAFKVAIGTIHDLVDHHAKGHPWMPALLDEGKRREQGHANYAEVLAADVDNTERIRDTSGRFVKDIDGKYVTRYSGELPLAAALTHPFICQHAVAVIESSSSSPHWPKMRIIFRLPEPILGWETIRTCNRYLIHLLGVADPACKDASRFFFGGKGREALLLNENACLPTTFVESAIAWAEGEERKAEAEAEALRQRVQQYRQQHGDVTPEDEIGRVEKALSYIAPYAPGQGRYPDLIAMAAGVINDLGAEGRRLLIQWDAGRGEWGRRSFELILDSIEHSSPEGRKATLRSLFYLARQEGYRPQSSKPRANQEPDSEEYAQYTAEQAERQKVEEAESEYRREQERQNWRNSYESHIKREQAKLRTIDRKPDVEIETRFLSGDLLKAAPSGAITVEDAQTGMGKTVTELKGGATRHQSEHPGAPICVMSNRRALNRQNGKILGLPVINDLEHEERYSGVFCPESTFLVNWVETTGAPFFGIDEADLSIEQLVAGSNQSPEQQARNLKAFQNLLVQVKERNGKLILTQDGVSQITVDFVREISGLELEYYIKARRPKFERNVFAYSKKVDVWHLVRDLSEGREIGLDFESSVDRPRILYPTDSIKASLRTEIYFQRLGLRSFFINKRTAETPEGKEAIKDPVGFARDNDLDCLGYTPTISAGNSIKPGFFTHIVGEFYHLPVAKIHQMVERYRGDLDLHLYIREKAVAGSEDPGHCLPKRIQKDLSRTLGRNANLSDIEQYVAAVSTTELSISSTLTKLRSDFNDESSLEQATVKAHCRYLARDYYDRLNLRENTLNYWQEERGWKIHQANSSADSELKKTAKKIAEQVELELAEEIACCDPGNIGLSEAQSILRTPGHIHKTVLKAKKVVDRHRYPGITWDDTDFVLKVKIQENGRYLRQVNKLWEVLHPEAAKMLDRWDWAARLRTATWRETPIVAHRLPVRTARIDLISKIPNLHKFITGKISEYQEALDLVQQVKEFCVGQASEFKRLCRLTFKSEHSGIDCINKILRHLGFEVVVARKEGGRGEQVRVWKIGNIEDSDRDLLLESLDQRFCERCDQAMEPRPIEFKNRVYAEHLNKSGEEDEHSVPARLLADYKRQLENAKDSKEIAAILAKSQFFDKQRFRQKLWDSLDRQTKLKVQSVAKAS